MQTQISNHKYEADFIEVDFMDINEKVLAAFQAEYREHLEGIRGVLGTLQGDEGRDQPDHIDEAFRLAHSLKGGARVCDLRPAETLAHGLENVFEQVRGGGMRLDQDVVRTINTVLDAIEDWMAAVYRNENPTDPREARRAVERLIAGESANCERAEVPSKDRGPQDLGQRLIRAFLSECPQYLAGLHEFAAALNARDREVASDFGEEAYRLAHNLRGSAQAAEIKSIEETAAELESLVRGLHDRTIAADLSAREHLTRHLDEIERELNSIPSVDGERRSPGESSASNVSRPPLLDEANQVRGASEPPALDSGSIPETSRKTAITRKIDSVRISTASLDTMLRTSRQLVMECEGQEEVNRELERVRRQVNQMQRERESFRRIAAASLNRVSTTPEFHRLAAYLEAVDRGLQSLSRDTRRVCAVQKRSSWRLQSRGRQIQQNVRQARMVPAEEVYQGLRKLVRDLANEVGKQVEFRVTGFDVRADRMVFQSLKDPLIHLLRNCVVHGIESPQERTNAGKGDACQVGLRIEAAGNRLTIEVDDDGRGIDCEGIARRAVERGLISRAEIAERSTPEIENMIFLPGFSTMEQVTEIAGRGMGLSVVRDAVTRLQGEIAVSRPATGGTRFSISVPACVSTHRLLIVSASDHAYAIPLHGIERLLRVKPGEIATIKGTPVVFSGETPVPLVSLTSVLGLENGSLKVHGSALQVAVLKSGARRLAVSVDAFQSERDLLIQDLDGSACSRAYLGAILLDDGQPALVLNLSELMQRARPAAQQATVETAPPELEKRTPRVLVVDDSFTTRTLEKCILEANGFYVGIAVDGFEGLRKLKSESYDVVISDVEMPRMDGFALLEEIKKDDRLSSTPVILCTSRSRREDQAKGLDLGAEAYVVKQKFDHQSLLSTIRQVVHG